ncbi:hypothetical protein [Desulfonatronum thioautotrophicum]|uniref:hypothetical protein n=1 Tax=Desulfonatronum thioautotrophicum TaxID=617001 RepID=UPI0012947B99|nr:hypothetical protein [Desulfonatronum thioautotrophicum]
MPYSRLWRRTLQACGPGQSMNVFVWAYERSCARYSAMRKSLGQPDPFRLRYRDLLAEVVTGVVRSRKDKKNAAAYIQQMARQRVNQEDVMRFIEIAETELMSLHEGNIARYRLRPLEYTAWRGTWK